MGHPQGSKSTAIPDSPASYTAAGAVLKHWMGLRPGLLGAFRCIYERPYPWAAGLGASQEQLFKTDSWGDYLYCELTERLPQPRADINVVTERSALYDATMETTIHASSMYSVHRTALKGLQPGTIPGKGGMRGVYCY